MANEKRLYVVKMENGMRYGVPVKIIIDSYNEYYSDEDIAEEIPDSEIKDWAENNMNWDDVEKYAGELPSVIKKPDFQDGWVNGEKSFITI